MRSFFFLLIIGFSLGGRLFAEEIKDPSFIPRCVKKMEFGLRQNTEVRRSQRSPYCMNTDLFAIDRTAGVFAQPKFQFFEASRYNIRPAQEEEIDTIYDLICELALFEGKDIASLPLTKEHLLEFGFGEKPYFFVEVVEVEEKIVGYALYYYGFSAHRGYPLLYIDDLYVQEAYRGQGFGTRLLEQLARYAMQHQCCRLEWHVFDWNESATAFYQKLGADFRKDLLLVRLEKEAMAHMCRYP